MARARSFPFDFLKNPDVIALSSDECLILIGMVLQADDHGRGFAHSTLLGREIRGYAPEQIEGALGTLQALELVTLYQVGRHRYYSLTRWQEWQKLRDPARSKFPAPPEQEKQESEELSDAFDFPQKKLKKVEESLEKFEKPQKSSLEVEVEEEEEEEEEIEREEEVEGNVFTNVVTFPTSPTSPTTRDATATISLFPMKQSRGSRTRSHKSSSSLLLQP